MERLITLPESAVFDPIYQHLRRVGIVTGGVESTHYGHAASEPTEGLVMRYRISIASMMAAILIMGLCLVALRLNSVFWGGMILLTTLALLCSAIFMSLAGSGPSRRAWIGCAVFGWPCFILGFGPVANERLGPPRTTEMFEEAIPYINPELDSEIKKYALSGGNSYLGSFPANITTYVPSLQRYRQSSHSMLTLGFATLGAILGLSHAVRRNPAAEPE